MKPTQAAAEKWMGERKRPILLPRTEFEMTAWLLSFAQHCAQPGQAALGYAKSRVGERGEGGMRGTNEYEFDALAEAFEAGLSSKQP